MGCTDVPATHNRSNSNSNNAVNNKGVNDVISRAESVFRRTYRTYTAAIASLAQGSPNFNGESVPHAVESIIKGRTEEKRERNPESWRENASALVLT